ncbi:MAG: class I SAM-dependent methyltransferase [Alphaproteobacteria bacterium]|nr:MAG: class I SAM-dependent methyltransferase [Alphaproteobacteria bacterium]
MSGEGPGLEDAYSLETPEDSVRLYRGWAETYDSEFAQSHGYLYADAVARTFLGAGGQGPVLDIGAGTGLVAEGLKGLEVDGLDISPEMLAVAAGKGLYRRTITADLTRPLDLPDAAYAGLVSAGTFTHGHVNADCLPELLRIARPGAVFALGINAQALDGLGFGSALAMLVGEGRITPVRFALTRIYAEGAGHEHADDRALIAVFEKL